MKTLRVTVFCLVAALACSAAPAAGGIKGQLVGNVWKMQRHTGLGDITTVWMFFEDDSGVAYQKVVRGGHIKTYNHRFTYKVDRGRVIVQEEIDDEWKGYFGVTRWQFRGNKLVSEVNFRSETPTFTTIDL